jgi:hypothetical protein
VREEIRRAPEQLHAGLGLLALEVVDSRAQVIRALGERRAFGPHVGVVEAVVGHAERRKQLECHVGLLFRGGHRVAEPRPLERLAAERIAAGPDERVPVAYGEAQMLLEALAEHDAIRVVPAKRERVRAVRPFVFDVSAVAEEAGRHS